MHRTICSEWLLHIAIGCAKFNQCWGFTIIRCLKNLVNHVLVLLPFPPYQMVRSWMENFHRVEKYCSKKTDSCLFFSVKYESRPRVYEWVFKMVDLHLACIITRETSQFGIYTLEIFLKMFWLNNFLLCLTVSHYKGNFLEIKIRNLTFFHDCEHMIILKLNIIRSFWLYLKFLFKHLEFNKTPKRRTNKQTNNLLKNLCTYCVFYAVWMGSFWYSVVYWHSRYPLVNVDY